MRYRLTSSAQHGQVLVLGVVFMAALLLLFHRAFWIGEISAKRMRQNSSTDFAVYSAAIVQARLLNMLALLNRAYVAHHIASAHLVTAASWAHFAQIQAQQFRKANPPMRLVAMLFGTPHKQAYTFSQHAQRLGDGVAGHATLQHAASAHAHFSDQVFVRIQQNLQQHFFRLAQRNAEQVLHRNNERTKPSPRIEFWLHQQPSLLFETVAAQSFVSDWIQASAEHYGFLHPRDKMAKNVRMVHPHCPRLRHQLRRRGQTKLDIATGWQSSDTLSLHALRSNRWIGCYYREYAMGYAWVPGTQGVVPHAVFSHSPPTNFAQQDFWRWVQEVTGWDLVSEQANPLANSYAQTLSQSLVSATLQPVLSLTSNVSTVRLTLQVIHHASTIPSHTQAMAEITYVAPFDAVQRSSLFMPYWQPRLVSEFKFSA